jgi:hypothetical protein
MRKLAIEQDKQVSKDIFALEIELGRVDRRRIAASGDRI